MSKIQVFLLILIAVITSAKANRSKFDDIVLENKDTWTFRLFRFFERYQIHLENYPPEVTKKIISLIFINLGLILFLHKLVPYLMEYNVV